jgi:hypothetical protein
MKKSELKQMIKEELNMFQKGRNMARNLKLPKIKDIPQRMNYAKSMERLIKQKLDPIEQKQMQSLLMRSVISNGLKGQDRETHRDLWLKVYDGEVAPQNIGFVWYPFDESDLDLDGENFYDDDEEII